MASPGLLASRPLSLPEGLKLLPISSVEPHGTAWVHLGEGHLAGQGRLRELLHISNLPVSPRSPAHLEGEVSLADIHSRLAVVRVQVEQEVICRGGGVSRSRKGPTLVADEVQRVAWLAPHDAQAQLGTQEFLQGRNRCCHALSKLLAEAQCVQTQACAGLWGAAEVRWNLAEPTFTQGTYTGLRVSPPSRTGTRMTTDFHSAAGHICLVHWKDRAAGHTHARPSRLRVWPSIPSGPALPEQPLGMTLLSSMEKEVFPTIPGPPGRCGHSHFIQIGQARPEILTKNIKPGRGREPSHSLESLSTPRFAQVEMGAWSSLPASRMSPCPSSSPVCWPPLSRLPLVAM
ncbi:hypothetical protein Cadr_000025363 [Camelus dromedarius]|uniref:Uncharacterized protein n=1 Tax=Camelus dromedarius TaxID=9838 RepID=A0A5N4CM87_CAMDR|nr:hypothetical protein Cadr_000025363 [Camelus dromedarius]